MRRDHGKVFHFIVCSALASMSAGFAAGCADGDERRISPRLVALVQVSKLEPSGSCQALGALEGHSDDDSDCALYESAYESLRTNAALRGGNYVVIDAVDTPHQLSGSVYDPSISIHGRVYACPLGMPYATAHVQTSANAFAAAPHASDTGAAGAEGCDGENECH